MVKGWLFTSNTQETEDVGKWVGCNVFDCNNVALHTDIHPKVRWMCQLALLLIPFPTPTHSVLFPLL